MIQEEMRTDRISCEIRRPLVDLAAVPPPLHSSVPPERHRLLPIDGSFLRYMHGLVIPLLHLSRAAHRLGIPPLFRLRFGDFPLFRFLFGDVVPYFGAMLSLRFCSFYSLVLGPSLIRSNLLQLM